MLPHAAHARQVVLELRELDLELALGARRVLREDVEDQLRPVDHARARARSRGSAAGRVELVVDEQGLGVRRPERVLQLLELPLADVGALGGPCAVLHELADRLDAGGARELLDLGELVVGVGALSQDREDEAALGLGPGGNVESSATIMPAPACRITTLAERTLELVDIPSESGNEAAALRARHAAVPLGAASTTTARRCSTRRAAGRPLVLLAGHIDTVPAQGNLPGRIEDGGVHGLGASDMKGGLAVMIELARWAAEAELAYDLALLFFPREELGPAENPLPGAVRARAARRRGRSSSSASSRPTTRSSSAASATSTRGTSSTARSAHSARPWRASTRSSSRSRACSDILEPSRATSSVDGLVFREVVSVTQIHGGIAANVIPARVEATINFRYAPGPHARGAERVVRSSSARRSRSLAATRRRRTSLARSPLVEQLARVGGFEVSRSRRGRTSLTSPRAASTRSTSAPARRATRTRSTSGSRSASSSGPSTRCSASSRVASERAPAPAVLAELAQYPFARLDDWKAEARSRGIELIDFGMGDPREVHSGVHPRGAHRRRSDGLVLPARDRAAGAARGGRRAGSSAASASRSTRRRRSCRRSARRRRSSPSHRSRARREAAGRDAGARATRCTSAERCSRAARS